MRFQRLHRSEYEATRRKDAAILRKQRRERESLPLFADQIAAEQPSVEAVHAERAQRWSDQEHAERARRAAKWREARAKLRGLPVEEGQRLKDYWNRHRWFPATPTYLCMVIHMHMTGRLDTEAVGMTHSVDDTGQSGSDSRTQA